ncbi:TIGR04211 family SH3 domain-containing protein [Pseudocolwellia sp. AS88]|jgi:SH3 domain protein|uniref:TIGR04211 family SH3 domain-containing protein n=1 Tax=Pseudocolwellia TaxID=2848177 RepID=UPI0026EF0F1D|nr:TIGR04211 family SH3 domain-containing protein [Pseudocolwellia sp. AS88]MDO7083773.1 TIGR04211 family SH3 domain-containing protein [Pseudocolwellia sp. AS88]
MTLSKPLFTFLLLLISSSIYLQASAQANTTQGYISDELPIFVHSGPGKNYRILGTVTSGSEVQITGNSKDDYSEVIDDKDRTVWLESKYVTSEPGLRVIIAQLNSKLADLEGNSSAISESLLRANKKVDQYSSEKTQLNNEISSLNKTLSEVSLKLKDQDTSIKKEWFFNGAIVLCIGLVLGLVLPRLSSSKKSNMGSWK